MQDTAAEFKKFSKDNGLDAQVYYGTLGKGDIVWSPPGYIFCELVSVEPCCGIKWPVVDYSSCSLARLRNLQQDFNLHATVPEAMKLLMQAPSILLVVCICVCVCVGVWVGVVCGWMHLGGH